MGAGICLILSTEYTGDRQSEGDGSPHSAGSDHVTVHFHGACSHSRTFQMKNFTVEETNLMCCFNTSSRKRLIDDMKSVTLNDMDGEIAELMYKTVRKLEAMTDAEFEELYIMPDGMVDD